MAQIRAVCSSDREEWEPLYTGYLDFYAQPHSALEPVWSWLLDGGHVLPGLVADQGGHLVGIAHFRSVPRPLSGTTAGYLDDLFVTPSARRSGMARALLDAVQAEARAQGWANVRWVTRASNADARRLYDQIAVATGHLRHARLGGGLTRCVSITSSPRVLGSGGAGDHWRGNPDRVCRAPITSSP